MSALDMEIPFRQAGRTDFDWFGVDGEGLIGHFATAGFKRRPPSIASRAEDLKIVIDYFDNLAPVRVSHRVDDKSLAAALQREWKGEKDEGRYPCNFTPMADKGLLSFDIEPYLKPGIAYFRVASPETPLTIGELPDNIQRIVSRTLLGTVRLKNQSRVPYDATLQM